MMIFNDAEAAEDTAYCAPRIYKAAAALVLRVLCRRCMTAIYDLPWHRKRSRGSVVIRS